MNHRQRVRAILHYEPYDHMPVVAFGYWNETLDKWADEGQIPREWAETVLAKLKPDLRAILMDFNKRYLK